MVQVFFILVLVVLIGFLLFFIVKNFAAPRKIEGIQKLIKQGKYSSAIKQAKAMITKDPRDFKAHYYLGKAYLADNKPELALMEFKTVNQTAIFDQFFSEIEFRKQIAQLYFKFNQPEEALKEYLLLTKLEPNNAENFYNAGKIFEQRNKSDQALSAYQKTIQLNKRHVKAHAALGLLLFKGKQYGEAKKEIDYAIRLSPETFSSYYYLGKILKESKDFAGAVNAFEKSLRDPEFKQRSLIERGSCYLEANNLEKAINEYDRAVRASKNESSQETLYARYFLASCYEKSRKIDQAIEQWEKIYSVNRSFKDVGAKLAEYKDIQTNDHMKEYLTSSNEQFMEICKKVALTAYNLGARNITPTKFGCKMVATIAKQDSWMNVRQQVFLMLFFRESDLIEDTILRKSLEEMKPQNYFKCIVCTSSGFTRTAYSFAENRPFELIPKEKLEKLLENANI